MSDAQFQKAVEIVRSLPPDGEVKPTQDQQLEVSTALVDDGAKDARQPSDVYWPCLTLARKPQDTDKTQFYAHFKQANEGDVSGPAPGTLVVTDERKVPCTDDNPQAPSTSLPSTSTTLGRSSRARARTRPRPSTSLSSRV